MSDNMVAIKELSAYIRPDKTNGKRKRDDPTEKESAKAISLVKERYHGYVQRRKQESVPTLKCNVDRNLICNRTAHRSDACYEYEGAR